MRGRVKELRHQYVQVNYWCALSELYCTSKMPVLLEVLETQKKRKHLLNSRIKIYFILFLCFFVENRGVNQGHETMTIILYILVALAKLLTR